MEREMSERDFQTAVLEKLGDLHAAQVQTATEVKAIVQRLDRLNGSVSRHEEHIGKMQIRIAERETSCPVAERAVSRITALEKSDAERAATAKQRGTWLHEMKSAILVILGVLATLALQNADKILAALPHR